MRVVALPIVCQAKRSRGWTAVLLLCAGACARTGLDPGELADGTGGAPFVTQLTAGTPALPPAAPSGPSGGAPVCVAAPEVCNGRDDDCNGTVDDLPAEACPSGGFRFCVAGRLSECPRRCDVCVAGSVRVCQNAFCSFWGEQECAADGQGFGNCREAEPPPECAATASKFQNSKQLEQCCLDNGYCCVDEHDLDGDGDRREMLGACGDIACQ